MSAAASNTSSKDSETINISSSGFQETHKHSANTNWETLGIQYFRQGNFQEALNCFEQVIEGLRKESLPETEESIENFTACFVQFGIERLCQNDLPNAKKIFLLVNKNLDFHSKDFVDLLLQYEEHAYQRGAMGAAINCSKALIKSDPEMNHSNYYHNLACYFAIQGDILNAHTAFSEALASNKAQTSTFVEYAQFILMHPNHTTTQITQREVSEILYKAILYPYLSPYYPYLSPYNTETRLLEYGSPEKILVCKPLQDAIDQNNGLIHVIPKALAYYLLLEHKELMILGDSQAELLLLFQQFCIMFPDKISFKLLVYAYDTIYVEGLTHFITQTINMLDKEYGLDLPKDHKQIIDDCKAELVRPLKARKSEAANDHTHLLHTIIEVEEIEAGQLPDDTTNASQSTTNTGEVWHYEV